MRFHFRVLGVALSMRFGPLFPRQPVLSYALRLLPGTVNGHPFACCGCHVVQLFVSHVKPSETATTTTTSMDTRTPPQSPPPTTHHPPLTARIFCTYNSVLLSGGVFYPVRYSSFRTVGLYFEPPVRPQPALTRHLSLSLSLFLLLFYAGSHGAITHMCAHARTCTVSSR